MKRFLLVLICSLALVPSLAFAQLTNPGTASPSKDFESNPFNKNLTSEVSSHLPTEYNRTDDPIVIVVRIIRVLFTFVGIGLTGLLVYAGFTWMTAAGDDGKVDTAKATIRNAVIGLLLVMASWSLATFIINRVRAATRAGALRLESDGLSPIYGNTTNTGGTVPSK